MAARVHDSVLQTLAMIQRAADSPQRVVQLARSQERQLRAWLFEGELPGTVGEGATTLAAAVQIDRGRGRARIRRAGRSRDRGRLHARRPLASPDGGRP